MRKYASVRLLRVQSLPRAHIGRLRPLHRRVRAFCCISQVVYLTTCMQRSWCKCYFTLQWPWACRAKLHEGLNKALCPPRNGSYSLLKYIFTLTEIRKGSSRFEWRFFVSSAFWQIFYQLSAHVWNNKLFNASSLDSAKWTLIYIFLWKWVFWVELHCISNVFCAGNMFSIVHFLQRCGFTLALIHNNFN